MRTPYLALLSASIVVLVAWTPATSWKPVLSAGTPWLKGRFGDRTRRILSFASLLFGAFYPATQTRPNQVVRMQLTRLTKSSRRGVLDSQFIRRTQS